MANNNRRMMTSVPSLEQLSQYNVNRAGAIEAVRQSLYDFQTYATAGQTSLIFFQIPQGQGGKTLADTNMESAGQLPSPKRFLVQSIEIRFYSGANPSNFGAGAVSDLVNDVWTVAKSGYLKFFIGSKDYLIEAPIDRFPPKTCLKGFSGASDATTAAAALAFETSYVSMAGRPYFLAPEILLEPTQNFSVSLNWPAAVSVSADARIGVILDGVLYRNSQ